MNKTKYWPTEFILQTYDRKPMGARKEIPAGLLDSSFVRLHFFIVFQIILLLSIFHWISSSNVAKVWNTFYNTKLNWTESMIQPGESITNYIFPQTH